MTREEEAIRCLSVHSNTNGSGLCTDKQHYEAKQMAIKALEQIDKIKQIIAIDNSVIQEDIMKYKMICEVVEE